MKLFKKLALTVGILSTILIAGQIKSEAASLTFNNDLKGYDATITTKNGQNILTTKKGTWELDENTQIYSSKNLTINLNNTQPVNIDSIYTPKDLEFRGSGELTADTDGQFGINVGGHLKAFKYTKKGTGKVVGKGTTAGVRAYNEIQMEGGTLEAYGDTYGIWCYNDIKPYYTAKIKAVAAADNGIGVWAYRDIYAWKGANVYGEGGASGAYTQIAHIQAEDRGSLIKGVSRNINSNLSALHVAKNKLRPYNGAGVVEEYQINSHLSDFGIDTTLPFNIQQFSSVDRNMNSFKNYAWSITEGPGSVQVQNSGLLLENLSNSTLSGTRTTKSSCQDKIQLKCYGTHTVILSNLSTVNGGGN